MNTAQDQYSRVLQQAKKYAERIKLAADDNFFLNLETHYWGSVGDAARVRDLLKEASDLIHAEGEYAP